MLNNKQLECDILLEYYKNQIKKFWTYNILQLQSDCDKIYSWNMSKIYRPIKDKLDLLIKDK